MKFKSNVQFTNVTTATNDKALKDTAETEYLLLSVLAQMQAQDFSGFSKRILFYKTKMVQKKCSFIVLSV